MEEITRAPGTRVLGVHLSSLYRDIENYQIDDKESAFKYSDRLARENLWTKEYTDRVIKEYKKFMFLACVCSEPVTPPIDVDEAWHLHMLYTRDYWGDFTKVMGQQIHHGPTKGGKKEDEKFVDWYERTKQRYFMYFSENPPEDIWPSSEIRFSNVHFARVDLLRHWIMPAGDWKSCLKCIWQHIKWKIKQLC